jgi:hypothetical protein
MHSKRGFVAGAIAAGLAIGAAIAPVQAQEKIKIGAVLSVTGPASFLGDPEAKTLKMLADDINKKGGLLGRQIEMVIYDSGGDAAKAKQFATRIVEDDKVVAQVGGSTTGDTMAMIPVFEEAKLPFISLAGAVVIIDPVKKFVFKTPHTDKMACQKIFEDMKKRGLVKIGMISGQDAFGKSMQGECLKVVKNYGIEVIAEETYGPRDTDMTPQLTNIKGKTQACRRCSIPARPGAGDRDAQLQAARDLGAALSEPRRCLERLHRRGGRGSGRRAAAGGGTADRRQTPRQRQAEGGRRRLHQVVHRLRQAAGLDLRATPTTAPASWSGDRRAGTTDGRRCAMIEGRLRRYGGIVTSIAHHIGPT